MVHYVPFRPTSSSPGYHHKVNAAALNLLLSILCLHHNTGGTDASFAHFSMAVIPNPLESALSVPTLGNFLHMTAAVTHLFDPLVDIVNNAL